MIINLLLWNHQKAKDFKMITFSQRLIRYAMQTCGIAEFFPIRESLFVALKYFFTSLDIFPQKFNHCKTEINFQVGVSL